MFLKKNSYRFQGSVYLFWSTMLKLAESLSILWSCLMLTFSGIFWIVHLFNMAVRQNSCASYQWQKRSVVSLGFLGGQWDTFGDFPHALLFCFLFEIHFCLKFIFLKRSSFVWIVESLSSITKCFRHLSLMNHRRMLTVAKTLYMFVTRKPLWKYFWKICI